MPESFEKTEYLDSAYRLVIVAAKRSKELIKGADSCVDRQAHKNTTVAIQEVKSERGVTAWLVEDYTVPIVTIRFSFQGGNTQDPPGNAFRFRNRRRELQARPIRHRTA